MTVKAWGGTGASGFRVTARRYGFDPVVFR